MTKDWYAISENWGPDGHSEDSIEPPLTSFGVQGAFGVEEL